MPANDPMPIGCTAIKPVERHGLDAIQWFLYDKDTGAIMGRTPKSWLLITIFYIIYYACLAAFWVLCLFIFFQFIEEDQPKWQQDGSLIGRSPALGVRPGQDADMIESSIIMFNYEHPKDEAGVPGYKGWVDRADNFLEPYGKAYDNAVNCGSADDLTDGQFCKFDLAQLGSCASGSHGFDSNSPCLILKLNKIYGLEPEYYNTTEELPDDMPDTVRDNIAAASNKNKIWVSCSGEYPADKEAVDSFEYFPPDAGFSSEYFPYLNQPGYQSPLVAVRLNNIPAGQLVHIECRAWAKNIKYDRRDRIGIVHFELVAHNEESAKLVNNNAAN